MWPGSECPGEKISNNILNYNITIMGKLFWNLVMNIYVIDTFKTDAGARIKHFESIYFPTLFVFSSSSFNAMHDDD
jgi:hypothetical protein